MKTAASTLDALQAFYIADELLADVIKSAKKDGQRLRRGLELAVKKVKKMPTKKLLVYAAKQWGPRYDNYLNSRWEYRRVPLAECGVWPRMGGLPDAATRGSVMDTAAYLRRHLASKKKAGPQLTRALRLEKLEQFSEIITEYVPIVVFEGGVIRHNKLATAAQRKRYMRCRYDIDDGNHRAVLAALHDETEVPALVGTRIIKNDLLYF